jgi:hypothetical protein
MPVAVAYAHNDRRADPDVVERAYRRDGFVRMPVFEPQEVRELRAAIYACFRRRHGEIGSSAARDLTSRDLLSESQALCAIVHPKITQLLQVLLGSDCVYVPDFEVHINQYGIGSGGWHIDCGSEIPQSYLLEPNYRFVKCGIYLQDNSADLAGGIDVLPGAHRWFPPWGSVKSRFRVQYVLSELRHRIGYTRLPIVAGDFVAFDSRLPHRGTAPGSAVLSRLTSKHYASNNFSDLIPLGRDKMVIYFDACRADYAESFLENSVRRARAEQALPFADQCRAQYLGLTYPGDFPHDFCRMLSGSGIRMVDYRGPDKDYWIRHWRQHEAAETG